MPPFIFPLYQIYTLVSAASSIAQGITGLLGILFVGVSLALMPILRFLDKILDEVLQTIENADLVIAVGGNYLYSHSGLYAHIIPLLYAKFVKKRKVLLLGHTLGPFTDMISHLKLKTGNILVAGDLSFLLQSSEIDRSGAHQKSARNKARVGINLRKWLFNKPELFKRYLDSVIDAIISFINAHFEVYLIPFSYVEGSENDAELCRLAYNLVPRKYRPRLSLLDVKDKSPTQVVDIMRKLRLRIFVGTRMHSVILASLAGIPSVAISYQHFKCHGISKQLGLEDYVIDIEKTDSNILLSNIHRLERAGKLEETVEKSVKKIRQRILSDIGPVLSAFAE